MSGLPTSVGSEVKGYALKDVNLVVVAVAPDSPASQASLKSGDKVISVKSSSDVVSDINPDNLKSFIVSHKAKEIEIGYLRGQDKNVRIAKVLPVENSAKKEPMIGISMDMIGIAKLPIFSALKEGMVLTWFVTKGTVVGLYTLIADSIRGQGSFSSVAGPVGMVGMVEMRINSVLCISCLLPRLFLSTSQS